MTRSLSEQLCRLVGLDPDLVRAIRYQHDDPQDRATITAEVYATDTDGQHLVDWELSEFITHTRTFTETTTEAK